MADILERRSWHDVVSHAAHRAVAADLLMLEGSPS